jgi:protein-S-isoprenylcysteine O-methyltransferase Ste14
MNPLKLPPFWFLLAVLAQFALAWNAGAAAFATVRVVAGYLLVAGGIALVLLAWREFRRHETPICTFREPSVLLTGGPFRFSRNPVYLGQVAMLLGLALLHGAWTALLPVFVFVPLMHRIFVRPEERMLRETFGDRFQTYRRRVRAWI